MLIADDEAANVLLLERVLQRAGYRNVVGVSDALEVLPLLDALDPDLILLDLHMPHLDGFEIMDALRPERPGGGGVPVLVLTADMTAESKRRALAGGASDFLTKPFDYAEALLRIQNLLRIGALQRELRERNQYLEEEVRERTREVGAAQVEVLERLAQVVEFHDDTTGKHTQRVGEVSARVAQALGRPDAEVELIRRAAPLHDVGKIGIPDAILLKPGKLTPEEFEVMKTHTTIGAAILSGGSSDLLRTAEEIALCHHERWDGSGYPRGLQGEGIPLAARIVAVADFCDALSNDRPYRSAWPVEQVLGEIERLAGSHFDPVVVRSFQSITGPTA